MRLSTMPRLACGCVCLWSAVTVVSSSSTPLSRLLTQLYPDTDDELLMFARDDKFNTSEVTYGEILPDSISELGKEFAALPRSSSHFWDLGAGQGKMVVQQFLEQGWRRAVGVELMPHRFKRAVQALDDLAATYANASHPSGVWIRKQVGEGATRYTRLLGENGELGEEQCFGKTDREVCMIKGDMTTVPGLEQAAAVFMCSTCFGEGLIQAMVKRLSKLAPGAVILSLKPLELGMDDFDAYLPPRGKDGEFLGSSDKLAAGGLLPQKVLHEQMDWDNVNVSVYKKVTVEGDVTKETAYVYTL